MNNIEALVNQTLRENASVVDQVKAGKEKAINILVGKILSQERNADPTTVTSLLRQHMGLKPLVKEKKQQEVVALVQKILRVIESKHEGGTLYGYVVGGDAEITFSTRDVVEKKSKIPEDILKYINLQFITT